MNNTEKQGFIAHASLPLFKKKVLRAKEIIKQALEITENAYVAVSWGKDSTVLLHLCQQIKPDILAVNFKSPYQELIHDYDGIIKTYCKQHETNYLELMTDLGETIPKALKRYKLYEQFLLGFIGIRKEENIKTRGNSLIKYGLIHQYKSGEKKGTYRCAPIGYWSWLDIWAYIVSQELPYLAIYDKLNRKTGRTCNVLPVSGLNYNMLRHGRISELKTHSYQAYNLAIQINPILQYLT